MLQYYKIEKSRQRARFLRIIQNKIGLKKMNKLRKIIKIWKKKIKIVKIQKINKIKLKMIIQIKKIIIQLNINCRINKYNYRINKVVKYS